MAEYAQSSGLCGTLALTHSRFIVIEIRTNLLMAHPSGGAELAGLTAIIAHVAGAAERSKAFGAKEKPAPAGGVGFGAKASGAQAFYRFAPDGGRLWVSLVTPDRYLSQSVEQDLVHTGDKMSDLLSDELIDLGCPLGPLVVEHFRSTDKLFTFRTAVPLSNEQLGAAVPTQATLDVCVMLLLAFERTFSPLGDMTSDGLED